MADETWSKIQAQIEAIEEADKTIPISHIVLNTKELIERRRHEERIQLAKRQDYDFKSGFFSSASGILEQVLLSAKKNYKKILEAKESHLEMPVFQGFEEFDRDPVEYHPVILKWGDKFQLTPEEINILKRQSSPLKPQDSEIVAYDYDYIQFNIFTSSLSTGNSGKWHFVNLHPGLLGENSAFSPSNNPDLDFMVNGTARLLRNPFHARSAYHRHGTHYSGRPELNSLWHPTYLNHDQNTPLQPLSTRNFR